MTVRWLNSNWGHWDLHDFSVSCVYYRVKKKWWIFLKGIQWHRNKQPIICNWWNNCPRERSYMPTNRKTMGKSGGKNTSAIWHPSCWRAAFYVFLMMDFFRNMWRGLFNLINEISTSDLNGKKLRSSPEAKHEFTFGMTA